MLIGFGCVLFLAYVTSKFIAGKSKVSMQGKYLNIVETITLGIDKKLCLIKVGNEFVLIAVSGKKIEFLCNVNIEEYKNNEELEKNKVFNFKGLLEKYTSIYKSKANKTEDVTNSGKGDSFRANLKKLKEITGTFNNKGRKDKDEGIDES